MLGWGGVSAGLGRSKRWLRLGVDVGLGKR